MQYTRYPALINYTPGKATAIGSVPERVFVATEKLHGANFAFVTDGQTVAIANRSKILSATDAFHGHATLIEQQRDSILALARTFQPHLKQLTVFGEIFGGLYPHSNVPSIENVRHVQRGVYYAPGIQFRIFDIHVVREVGIAHFLDFDEVLCLGNEHKLPVVPILCRGTLAECLAIDVETLVPAIPNELGLPPLERLDNVAEGIVVRPVTECHLKNRMHAILKRKAKRYAEVMEDVSKPADELVVGSANWSPLALNYVTENRLRNLLSKQTTLFTDMGQIMALVPLLCADALDDFRKDHVEFLTIKMARQREVNKDVTEACKQLLELHSPVILGGSF